MKKSLSFLFGTLFLISGAIAQANSISQMNPRMVARETTQQTAIKAKRDLDRTVSSISVSSLSSRRSTALEMQIAKPFPKTVCQSVAPSLGSVDTCVLGNLDYAIAALSLSNNATQIAQANTDIQTAIDVIGTTPGFTDLPDPKHPGQFIPFSNYFHFDIAPLMFRIDSLFGPNGKAQLANRLQSGIHQQIVSLFANFVQTECPISYANPLDTWTVYGSENHAAMLFSTCWSGAQLLVNDPGQIGAKFVYADGSKPQQQLAAWIAYFKAYERERAKRGMLIEYFSDEYAKYTLTAFYNLVDFTGDQPLRAETTKFLNLWWADWAQEQIDGFDGGAKTRFYPEVKNLSSGTPLAGIPWLYFNLGSSAGVQDPAVMEEVTSTFVPDPIIADIASDIQGRGAYEAWSRRVGLQATNVTNPTTSLYPVYPMDDASGGIARYTYVTPSFVMGTSMYPRLLPAAWAAIDSQNRLNDLVLSSGKRIAAVPNPLPNLSNPSDSFRAYNDTFAVQHKGVQIIAPLPAPYSQKAGGMQVWYSPGLTPVRNNGWIFFNDSAFVAVRSVVGTFTTSPSEPNWLICSNPASAVIIEAVPNTAYQSFQAFQNAMIASRFSVEGQGLSFTGLLDAGAFDFDLDGSVLPSINGTTIDVTPPYAYKSPFVNESWGSGLATVTKGGKTLSLDFTNNPNPVTTTLIADQTFTSPSMGSGWYAYQYSPAGSPWTFSGTSGLAANGTGFTYANPNSPSGSQVAFIQEKGSMSQTISGLLPNHTYYINVIAAARNLLGKGNEIEVDLGSLKVMTINPLGTQYANYPSASFTPNAAATQTLTVKGLNPDNDDQTTFLNSIILTDAGVK